MFVARCLVKDWKEQQENIETDALRKLDDMIDNVRPASEYVRNLLKTYKNENSSQE
jgi:hypothetical protein